MSIVSMWMAAIKCYRSDKDMPLILFSIAWLQSVKLSDYSRFVFFLNVNRKTYFQIRKKISMNSHFMYLHDKVASSWHIVRNWVQMYLTCVSWAWALLIFFGFLLNDRKSEIIHFNVTIICWKLSAMNDSFIISLTRWDINAACSVNLVQKVHWEMK